jgi:hypothetical protein
MDKTETAKADAPVEVDAGVDTAKDDTADTADAATAPGVTPVRAGVGATPPRRPAKRGNRGRPSGKKRR